MPSGMTWKCLVPFLYIRVQGFNHLMKLFRLQLLNNMSEGYLPFQFEDCPVFVWLVVFEPCVNSLWCCQPIQCFNVGTHTRTLRFHNSLAALFLEMISGPNFQIGRASCRE